MDQHQLADMLAAVLGHQAQNFQQLFVAVQPPAPQAATLPYHHVEVPEYHGMPEEDVTQWAFMTRHHLHNTGVVAPQLIPRAAEGFRHFTLTWYMGIQV